MKWTLVLASALFLGYLAMHFVPIWRGPRRVFVCTSDGRPVPHAALILRRAGHAEPDFGATGSVDGWVAVRRDQIHDGAEMLVTAPGFGVVRGALPGDGRVTLPGAIAVTFRVGGDFDLPRPPRGLRLEVVPNDDGSPEAWALRSAVVRQGYRPGVDWEPGGMLQIDPDTRSAEALVPRAGPWVLEWSVGVEAPVSQVGVSWSGSGPAKGIPVEIREAGEIVNVEIGREPLEKYSKR